MATSTWNCRRVGKGDALAAAGKRDEALRAYGKALTLFYQQNPSAPEPPRALLQAIDRVEGER